MSSLLLKLILNLITIAVVIASIDDMKIIRADMSEPMRRHALGEAFLAIEKETNNAVISNNLAKQMGSKFGNPWIILVGKSMTGLSIDPIPKTFLSFSYEDIYFEMFKPLFAISAPDAILESRITNPTITIHKTELETEDENFAMEVIKKAIHALNDFDSIAINITEILNKKFGDFWQVFVGTNPIETNSNHINGTYIHVTIEQIVIILFQTNAQQNKINLDSVITRAIESNATIITKRPPEFDKSSEIIEMAKNVLQKQIGICKNCYEVVSKELRTQLQNKYSPNWEVSVGIKDTCDSNPYRPSTVDLDFFLAEVLFRVSRYG